ncbi:glycosyl transferase family 2 [Desulfofundulus kuznetsovii DSM 6115]|uniref:Glycosyl transferase family 2 n=2 Tax=Desulfofundulus kuznetsovii TaxID=58135 RepID=A0AAU8PHY9_DESK7|nr:glycosyl transferase family 2 [Desulfofundulus kuznetsovii DSM 6115]
MTPTVALAMIVRNEEANLAACLDSVKGAVDEIVIVDTGSTDRTVEIARRYTGKVYRYPWHGDFSAARNYALARTKSDWILSLDADEELDTSPGDLRSLINNNSGYEAFFLPLHNRTTENPGDYNRFFVLRLFRNKAGYRFQGVIHEQVVISRPEAVGTAQGPVIWHRPLSKRERNRKRGRNLALLRQAVAADPANPFLQYYLGVEWLGLGKAERALPYLQEALKQLTDGHILFRAPAIRLVIACLRALGNLDEAICICMEESQRYPFYTDLFFDGGILFEEKGEYEIALKWFKEALHLGQPPPLFSHTNGTESFLSLYHLGYCHEKLAMFKEAKNCYEKALALNPAYLYPLYNLFLLHLAEKGPQGTFDHLKAAGHLNHPQQVVVLADLFFEAGFPDLACACIEEAGPGAGSPTEVHARRLARFCVYAGRCEHALSLMERIRHAGGEIDTSLAIDEIVALMLKEDYRLAKIRTISLWRRPQGRSPAWTLLNLISLLGNSSRCGRPEKNREPAVIETALTILENCLRYRPGPLEPGNDRVSSGYHRLAQETIKLLTSLSPRGCIALCAYLKEKASAARHMLDYKCGPARGLFS